MFKKILIANRGEIAVRIIRCCKEMGIEAVAVYSSADATSLHVQLADEAYCIGPAKSSESYLNMENILSVATLSGCDAIHPGFGYLSENSTFARLVEECGMTFIGPSGDVIDQMGNKSVARQMMIEAGVPVVPGSDGSIESVSQGKEIARKIGYPVLIKASAGGGGRGMRKCFKEEDFEDAVQYVEEKNIGLNTDDSENKLFLDSSKIAIVPKTLSVESIVKKIRYEEINLDTEFQRKRSLWKNDVKSQLIESFMVQLPVPPMYFDGKDANSWLVIDGLQRLCTLKEFLLDKTLILSDMEYLADYNGCTFDDLPRIYQRRVEEAQIAFYLILPDTPENVKYSLFKRINTPGLKLEPQEIRHALYQGKATIYLKELAENEIFTTATDGDVLTERMLDREMVLRYLALRCLGEGAYKNNTLNEYLCETMDFLNSQEEPFFRDNKELFFKALECCYHIFGRLAFRRISYSRPTEKKPFNSALFEGWTNAVAELSEQERLILEERKEILIQKFIAEIEKRSTFNNDISSGKYRSFVRRNEAIRQMVREVLEYA